MVAYQQEKIDNAICYFASEHAKRAGKAAYQTYIYKYIALFDFEVMKRTGVPALDIKYAALDKGPVPDDLYNRRTGIDKPCYKFIPIGENSMIIEPKTKPNFRYFSEIEIEIMNELLDEFAHPWITTDDMIAAAHDRIRSWQVAWEKRGNKSRVPMDYSDEFEKIDQKSSDELSVEEDRFLVFKGLKEAAGT